MRVRPRHSEGWQTQCCYLGTTLDFLGPIRFVAATCQSRVHQNVAPEGCCRPVKTAPPGVPSLSQRGAVLLNLCTEIGGLLSNMK